MALILSLQSKTPSHTSIYAEGFVFSVPTYLEIVFISLLAVTLCDPSPCKNGATCVVAGGTYRCICPQGKAGPDCEESMMFKALAQILVRFKKSISKQYVLYRCLSIVKQQKCTPTFCQNGGVCKEPEDPTKPPFCICKTNKFVPPNCGMYLNCLLHIFPRIIRLVLR